MTQTRISGDWSISWGAPGVGVIGHTEASFSHDEAAAMCAAWDRERPGLFHYPMYVGGTDDVWTGRAGRG
jgi:hypothetical protein